MHNTSLAWKTPASSPVAIAVGFDAGKQKYRRGKRLEECLPDAEARGWLAAEANGAQCYLRAMQESGMSAADAMVVIDAVTGPGWTHMRESEDGWRYPNVH